MTDKYRVFHLVSGAEIVAAIVSESHDRYEIDNPYRADVVSVGDYTTATKLDRFSELSDTTITLYKSAILADSACSKRVMDYYIKMVEIYNNRKQGDDFELSADEIKMIKSGKVKLQ